MLDGTEKFEPAVTPSQSQRTSCSGRRATAKRLHSKEKPSPPRDCKAEVGRFAIPLVATRKPLKTIAAELGRCFGKARVDSHRLARRPAKFAACVFGFRTPGQP